MAQGQETPQRPTLLSGCARASSAAESRYRITAKPFAQRSSRVIALDHRSAAIVGEAAGQSWGGGHFLVFESALPDDALLRRAPGGRDQDAATALLSEELDGADTVVMVASAAGSAAAASLIGDAAAARGIMSAGLVIQGQDAAATAPGGIVSALRPNAMVLVILRNATDLTAVLSALRV